MNWAEKIIGLKPLLVTGAFFLAIALGAIVMELMPMGTALSQLGFALAAALSFVCIFAWVRALHDVADSRRAPDPVRAKKADEIFGAAIFATASWCVLVAVLPFDLFAVQQIATLITGFFWLRVGWVTVSALLEFEQSNDWFWTTVQVVYFPLGVWFLQPRLQRLLSAPAQTELSAA